MFSLDKFQFISWLLLLGDRCAFLTTTINSFLKGNSSCRVASHVKPNLQLRSLLLFLITQLIADSSVFVLSLQTTAMEQFRKSLLYFIVLACSPHQGTLYCVDKINYMLVWHKLRGIPPFVRRSGNCGHYKSV